MEKKPKPEGFGHQEKLFRVESSVEVRNTSLRV